MNNSFIFFGCWNNINCEKEAIYRDVVLNCIKEFEPSTKKMFIAGDNWYNTLIKNKGSIDASKASDAASAKNEPSYKYYLVDTLVSGYHILYTMKKDIYICVGNHDEASSSEANQNCMIKTQKHYIKKLKEYIDDITISLDTVKTTLPEATGLLQGTEGDYENKMIRYLLDSDLPFIEELESSDDDLDNCIKLYSDKNIGVYEDACSSYIVIIINTNLLSDDYLKSVGKKIIETKKKSGNQNKCIFVMGHIPLFYDKHKKGKVDKKPKKTGAVKLSKKEQEPKKTGAVKLSKKEQEPKGEEDITKLKKGTFGEGEDKSSELIDSLYGILAENKCIYLCADCHNFNIMSIKKGGDKCVIQITSGTGGADPDIIKDLKDKKEVDISEYNITYYSINSYGYCKIVVEDGGSVVVSYNKIIAADKDNKSIDELHVYRVKNNEIECFDKEKIKNAIILNAARSKYIYCNRVDRYKASTDVRGRESNVIKSQNPNNGVCYKKEVIDK
jgi:hypothetical protein